MKKPILILLTLLLTGVPLQDVSAQDSSTEIWIGTGIGTFPNLFDSFQGIATSIGSLGNASRESTSYQGNFYLKGKHRISNRLDIGGSYVFQPINSNLIRGNSIVGTQKTSWHSIMGVGDFYWMRRQSFGLFTGAGIGIAFANETRRDNETREEAKGSMSSVALQLNLIGVQFGRQLSTSLTFGIGFEGLASLGVGYRF